MPTNSLYTRLIVQVRVLSSSDDSAVVGCISDGQQTEYREEINRFVAWHGNNHFVLNVNKTKEMAVDFMRTMNKYKTMNSISVMGEEMDVVEYKYLIVHLDNTLDWRCNTDAVYKKGQNRLAS